MGHASLGGNKAVIGDLNAKAVESGITIVSCLYLGLWA